jgi:hypothetical protein
MPADLHEIARDLAVACLEDPDFVEGLMPKRTETGEAELMGEMVGQFYKAIYKVVAASRKEKE